MANRIAQDESDDAYQNVDQAIDSIIAGLIVLQENLPEVKTENVPQRAALDNVEELLNEALLPYMSDVVKQMQVFGE
jgi:hypothetical protein